LQRQAGLNHPVLNHISVKQHESGCHIVPCHLQQISSKSVATAKKGPTGCEVRPAQSIKKTPVFLTRGSRRREERSLPTSQGTPVPDRFSGAEPAGPPKRGGPHAGAWGRPVKDGPALEGFGPSRKSTNGVQPCKGDDPTNRLKPVRYTV